MDDAMHARGLANRRKVLGDAHVDAALAKADDLTRDFQRFITQYAWGEVWGDDTLTPRERSMLTLVMLAALGKMEEFALHVRASENTGVTPGELRALIQQVAIYCGVPIANDCFRVAQPIVTERTK